MYFKITNVCYWNAFSILIKHQFTLTQSNQQNPTSTNRGKLYAHFPSPFFIHNYSFCAEKLLGKVFPFFFQWIILLLFVIFFGNSLLYFCYLFNCKIVGKVVHNARHGTDKLLYVLCSFFALIVVVAFCSFFAFWFRKFNLFVLLFGKWKEKLWNVEGKVAKFCASCLGDLWAEGIVKF